MLADECPGLFVAPVKKWVKFKQLVGVVPFEFGHVLAVGRLLGADAGDPDRLVLEGALQGFHLSDMAAGFAVFDGFVKGIGAVGGDKILQLGGIGRVGFDGLTVSFEGARPGRIGLGK